ncbi:ABC transporter ATP-binding protein [Brevibacillus ruminantium]|uniref:ABC transporter ATP-binding protein n=1 Tax=Brevibacillus ruminantium TaxID=2950604 RepID=A0ABY4WAY1_9BACL|nr:ABC transporter ATP-binding protein [Brevibacillus ruminantium]USG63929.1 ABC transporter ATP-binding protein [Brevibacillus ruminantium]
MSILEATNLCKRYGNRTVVDDVSLSVNGGEMFGFLGRNGAGKSTFINMLTGIIRPTSGRIRMFEGEGRLDDWKRRTGVLPDYSTFYDSLTAAEHLRYFARVKGVHVDHQTILSLLKQVELDEHRARNVRTFSFGMKKKLGIAQAMLGNPDMLFLDEPTSGVDIESAFQIQQLLRQLQQQGKTIFFTSHNLHEVEKICTRIAIMKAGRIASIGSLDALRAEYQLWRTVSVRHSSIATGEQQTFHSFLKRIGRKLEWGDNRFSLQVDSEQKVAALIRAVVELRVDIYCVNVEEASLENIFLA